MTTRFTVGDATCGHCKATIESTVSALADVTMVDFDIESKQLRVEHGELVSVDELSSAIRNAGYTPEPIGISDSR